ncbi:MAG: LPS export ABC transporter periplasmic protein LptC [Burkholderiaceae bacterium]|nr:LPS export ABC transporter periplasmic protein LptC [Burkholderiaceae bacterium]
MRQRLYDRLAAAVSIGLLAVLAAFTYYLAELADQFRDARLPRALAHEPDYFVEQFAVTRLNQQGEPLYRMSAERLTHFADDDSSEFDAPVLVSLDPLRPKVTLSALHGKAGSRARETWLYGEVVLARDAFDRSAALRVETEYIALLVDEDIARTDRAVTITSGASSLTGVGMELNNATRVLTLNSKVRGHWPPPSAR